ncbi:MAG: patatin-like phospholipase family protein [Actinomycetota bacterium]
METRVKTAFVLGGGGLLGASEVGMLRALLERAVIPDLIVGTSIGALNGAVLAADPSLEGVARLADLWGNVEQSGVFSGSMLGRITTLARTRTHAHPREPLRELIEKRLTVSRIEDLKIEFQCVAASIELAAEHWFTEGPIADAVLASSAVPGLLPPVRIGDEHFFDGGLVNSIPVDRAVSLGASLIFVLQVGRIEQPLTVPTKAWEVGLVAFEIARRHRFAEEMKSLPSGVTAHVLPSGEELHYNDLKQQLRYSDASKVEARIERGYAASSAFLDELGVTG